MFAVERRADTEYSQLEVCFWTQRGSRRPAKIHAYVGESIRSCLPTRCILATLFGKDDDLQFPSLRVDILIRRISANACLMCSMAQVEALEATGIMNARRFATV